MQLPFIITIAILLARLWFSSLIGFCFQQGKCRFNKHLAIVNITSWAVLPARDERALEIAIANIGPVAVSINAAPHTFQFYQ